MFGNAMAQSVIRPRRNAASDQAMDSGLLDHAQHDAKAVPRSGEIETQSNAIVTESGMRVYERGVRLFR